MAAVVVIGPSMYDCHLTLGNWRTAVTRSTIQSSKLARSSSLNTGSDILGLIPGLLPSTLKLTEMGSYVHGYMRYTGVQQV